MLFSWCRPQQARQSHCELESEGSEPSEVSASREIGTWAQEAAHGEGGSSQPEERCAGSSAERHCLSRAWLRTLTCPHWVTLDKKQAQEAACAEGGSSWPATLAAQQAMWIADCKLVDMCHSNEQSSDPSEKCPHVKDLDMTGAGSGLWRGQIIAAMLMTQRTAVVADLTGCIKLLNL